MLLTGLCEVNKRLEEIQSDIRFIEAVDNCDGIYDIFTAKKKSGKPKDEEPSKLVLSALIDLGMFRLGVAIEGQRRKCRRQLIYDLLHR